MSAVKALTTAATVTAQTRPEGFLASAGNPTSIEMANALKHATPQQTAKLVTHASTLGR